MSTSVASENTSPFASATLRRTVAVVDMVGYSSIAKILEESISAASVADLNRQIQAFMFSALDQLPDREKFCVIARTGDGIILLFEAVDDAHLFAHHVHLIASQHNQSRAEGTAKRRFRVGIATGDVSATACSSSPAEYAGITIANAVRLEAAAHAGEIVMDASSFAALSPNLQHLYGPETSVRGKREEIFRVHRFQVIERPRLHAPAIPPHLTRRSLLATAALVAAGTALTGYWEAPRAKDWIWARSHPLPPKRFVALMGWLTPNNPVISPAVSAVLTAIENELTRAESVDRNLLILPYSFSGNTSTLSHLNSTRDSLGANLVLTASGRPRGKAFHLDLSVIGSSEPWNLRQTTVRVPLNQQTLLPERAVQAATDLLEITGFLPNAIRSRPATLSAEAYAAFQSAELLVKQDNDSGLVEAIQKYKRAIELDEKYAEAHARLAVAYCRVAIVDHNPAAIGLAGANASMAVSLDPSSISAHMALASVFDQNGDEENALDEMKRALALDPLNTQTLIWRADILARLNRWQDAEQALISVTQHHPNNWLAHNQLGVLLNEQGKYRESLQEFQLAGLAAPRSTLALNNIGGVYLQVGRPDDCVMFCKKSIDIKPTSIAAVTMAAALRTLGKVEAARETAHQATQLDPGFSSAWLELGDCFSLAPAKTRDATLAYQAAKRTQSAQLEVDASDGPGFMLFALLQAKCNSDASIMSNIQKADAMHAGDMDSQLYKARTLEILGRRSEALATIRSCLACGATSFQIETMPDMQPLVADPRYRSLMA